MVHSNKDTSIITNKSSNDKNTITYPDIVFLSETKDNTLTQSNIDSLENSKTTSKDINISHIGSINQVFVMSVQSDSFKNKNEMFLLESGAMKSSIN
jgi:hypothetical protein